MFQWNLSIGNTWDILGIQPVRSSLSTENYFYLPHLGAYKASEVARQNDSKCNDCVGRLEKERNTVT